MLLSAIYWLETHPRTAILSAVGLIVAAGLFS
jgi:hypothetical protein